MKFFRKLAMAVGICLVGAIAQAADLDGGVAWLQAQQQSSGAYDSGNSMALPPQATSEALGAFSALSVSGNYSAPLAFLNAQESPNTEWLARRIISAAQTGVAVTPVLTQTLLSYQNKDGGFGALQGYDSHALDTAWAVKAFYLAGQGSSQEAKNALSWLLNKQRPGGDWLNGGDEGADNLILTAQAIDAVWHYRNLYEVRSVLDKGRQWLMQQQTGGTWSGADNTAWALKAILPGLADTSTVQGALVALEQEQQANGSWADDVYLTSISLQALAFAALPVPNPDYASITGVILDRENDQPLTGASLQLLNANLNAVADSQGCFVFAGLNAGDESLLVSVPGYASLQSTFSLRTGQRLDLGHVRLNKAPGPAAIIKGVARYRVRDDIMLGAGYLVPSRTGIASGAIIRAGGLQTVADAQGNYQIEGIPPGTVVIHGTYLSYPQIQTTATARAGETIVQDLLFRSSHDEEYEGISVKFVVTDQQTGDFLQGVYTKLQNLNDTSWISSGSTDANGESIHNNFKVKQGPNNLWIQKSGYEGIFAAVDIDSWREVVIPVALRPLPNTKYSLSGLVTDKLTQMPVSGVTVAIPDKSMQTITNAQGEYAFVGDRMNVNNDVVVFSKNGYETASYGTIQLSSGQPMRLDMALTPSRATSTEASLRVEVIDAMSMQPIENAKIIIGGATSAVIQTDSAGMAEFAPLSKGATRVQINAQGYRSAFSQFEVAEAAIYDASVQLTPDADAQPGLYGTVRDAMTQLPVEGAQVVLTGANNATTSTNSAGAYEFTNLGTGQTGIQVQHDAYVGADAQVYLEANTEVDFLMATQWSLDPNYWEILGGVIDAKTGLPVAGATITVQENFNDGITPPAEQTVLTSQGGEFHFERLTQDSLHVIISAEEYKTKYVSVPRRGLSKEWIGYIQLERKENLFMPDLKIERVDRSALKIDDSTFIADGSMEVSVVNNSAYDAGASRVIAFFDHNFNGLYDPGEDEVLAEQNVPAIPQRQSVQLTLQLKDAELPFRDAPVYVVADAGNEVIESIETNNIQISTTTCQSDNAIEDVAVCIDTSGSVGALVAMEKEGVMAALKDPNIIPHDGSVRFTFDMSYNTPPFLEATVVTPASLPGIIARLETPGNYGGASFGARCARSLSVHLKAQQPASVKKSIVLVGDGDWGGEMTQVAALLAETVSNGVSRIDTIGVGVYSATTLEDNAWPKPVNQPGGGRVTFAYSEDDIATVIKQIVGLQIQGKPDLSLGGLALIDDGAGRVTLSARVGNAGSGASLATTVRFYQGTSLLGEADVNALQSSEFVDVKLANLVISGSEEIRAVVDEQAANAECNIGNNHQQIAAQATNVKAGIVVSTNQPAYTAGATALLQARIANNGNYPANLRASLQINDAHGDVVVRFDPYTPGAVSAGGVIEHSLQWSTGNIQAGTYSLVGTLYDGAGQKVGEDSALFNVLATGVGMPTASLQVSTDKASYANTAQVSISALLNNLSSNHHISGAYVVLTVLGPDTVTQVFTQRRDIGALPSNGVHSFATPQALLNAALGSYTLTGELYDGNAQLLAVDTATYEVVNASVLVPSIAGLSGTLTLGKTSLHVGESQSRADELINAGSTDMDGLVVTRSLWRESDGAQASEQEHTITLHAAQTLPMPQQTIDTSALGAGFYTALLIADYAGQKVLLDSKRFEVRAGGGGVVTPSATPIPATPLAAMLLMCLLTALYAVAQLRRSGRARRHAA